MNTPSAWILATIALAVLSACKTPQTNADQLESNAADTSNAANSSSELALLDSTLADQGTLETDASNESANESANESTSANSPEQNARPVGFIPTTPTRTGELQLPALSEVSGLAAASAQPNTFWAINDSGNEATVYAFNHVGASLDSFDINATNRDWEDLASATINGITYLLIADIGDNLETKTEHRIYVIAEPLLNEPAVDALQPIYTLRFRYPDRAHNSESIAYADGYVYVLTKEGLNNGNQQASQAFRVPLNLSDDNSVKTAEPIASLAIPSLSLEGSLIATIGGVDISQPTALAIDKQNRFAYVLTYRSVYRYERNPDQSWRQVFAQPRTRIHSHSLSQAEALTVNSDGVVWFTSEQRPAPLWALPAADY